MFKSLVKLGLVGLAGYGIYKLFQFTVGASLIYGNKEVAKWAHEMSNGKMSEEEFKNKIKELLKENSEYIKSLKDVKEENKVEEAIEA